MQCLRPLLLSSLGFFSSVIFIIPSFRQQVLILQVRTWLCAVTFPGCAGEELVHHIWSLPIMSYHDRPSSYICNVPVQRKVSLERTKSAMLLLRSIFRWVITRLSYNSTFWQFLH